MYLILILLFTPSPRETNPVKIVVNAGINIYQKLISSAQGDVCNFSPSCSNFARQSISEYGILWGSLMTADRLMRCQPGAYKYYNIYYREIKDGRLYDPPKNNYIWERTPAYEKHRAKDTR